MNKEDLKKIKVLYYPYKAVKKVITGIVYYVQYIISLFYISKNIKRVKKKIANGEVLNVVFIIQYIPGWNKLEPIYKKMLDDDRFNPIIVCVPLNIHNHKLMDDNGNDTYQYFIEHGYETINALLDNGSWFDLRQLKPDYLFHSRPYNAFMPKCYTSDEIVQYALICNVLYGSSVTVDMRAVTINNDYFKDVYFYFAVDDEEFDCYRNRFKIGFLLKKQKCYPYGAIGLEQMLESKLEKEVSAFKKTIIWTPRWSTHPVVGGSNFFNYKQTILDIAKEGSDVLFLIRPHPLMFNNFIKTGEMTSLEVSQFKDYCRKEKNIIVDESKEYTQTFWQSDFLITDVSSIVPEYFVTHKPIIYCHSNIDFHYTKASQEMINSCYEVRCIDDLKKAIYFLLNNDDSKLKKRNDCIEKCFSHVVKNSENILNTLAKI